MSTPLPVGPQTPYVTPTTLLTAPTGIAWSTIPPGKGATPAQNQAELANICARATAEVDGYCNQVLRATINTEMNYGPDYRVTVNQYTGNTRVMMESWPVLEVNEVQVSAAASWPRSWTTMPSNYYEPEVPVSGIFGTSVPSASATGGQAITLAPGYVNWGLGRGGFTISITYTNGWPHCGLASPVEAGASTIEVDDCTGWAIQAWDGDVTGATGTIKDSGRQEVVMVTAASTNEGPGTLTLAAPIRFNHDAGIALTTLPASVEWACILFCTAEALTRGATTTTIHSVGGHAQGSGAESEAKKAEGELMLHPYRRVI